MSATAIQAEGPQPAPPLAAKPVKKKLVRRLARDHSQAVRRVFQAAFLLLNVWIGIEFYLWVRHYESGGATPLASRPAGVEGYLPIAALMNLKAWVLTGSVPPIHSAGMFLLLAFLGISIVFRKAFCSWLCPIGTVSEYLWKAGRWMFGRVFVLPRWLDIPLRGLKYILLGLFFLAVGSMSAEAILLFMQSPYGLIADVKMLNFFRFMSTTAAVTIVVLVWLSLFVQNFWCRYLCPYGALMGLGALLSPLRIRREAAPCIDCGKCAKACPSQLPVDKLVQIRSAECMACLECVAVCPAQGALQFSAPRRRMVPVWTVAAGIALIFLGVVGAARFSGHWDTQVPAEVLYRLVPEAENASHPMPRDFKGK